MTEWVEALDERAQRRIRDLIADAADADGVAPVGEHVLRELSGARTRHLVDGPDPHAYLNLTPAGENTTAMAELVVAPNYRRRGIGTQMAREAFTAGGEGTRIWAHGDLPPAQALAASLSLVALRRLHRMQRPLADLPAIPDHAGITVRHYLGPQDDSALLRVNNAAFSWHPEQGGWTGENLAERFGEPWFDPHGLFLAVDETGGLLGFHWTKRHLDKPGVGEVYVVGVDPAAQGRGVGQLLTLVGMHHLADRGQDSVQLYVESDNVAALRTYERLGFVVASTDAAYGHS